MPSVKQAWNSSRRWAGYILFVVAIGYALYSARTVLQQVSLEWIGASAVFAILVFFLQLWQMHVFIKSYSLPADWSWLGLFVARRAVLNNLLPSRTGTLLILHTLTKRYSLRWYDYVHFMLHGSAVSLIISGIALVSVLLHNGWVLLALPAIAGLAFAVGRKANGRSVSWIFPLVIIGFLQYLCLLGGFWSILRGFGYGVGYVTASYFGVLLNTLAQIAITPGNLGVREVLAGMLARYTEVPASVGILAGAAFYGVRVAMNALLLVPLELRFKSAVRREEPV